MKEYVLVEFLLPGEDYPMWNKKLEELDDDFICLTCVNEYETDEEFHTKEYIRITGKISSQYASVIKLQDPYLAQRMRISYISDELKNKYRK